MYSRSITRWRSFGRWARNKTNGHLQRWQQSLDGFVVGLSAVNMSFPIVVELLLFIYLSVPISPPSYIWITVISSWVLRFGLLAFPSSFLRLAPTILLILYRRIFITHIHICMCIYINIRNQLSFRKWIRGNDHDIVFLTIQGYLFIIYFVWPLHVHTFLHISSFSFPSVFVVVLRWSS